MELGDRHLEDRHYRVVRYYPHFGHGLMKEVLAENLTLEEATRVREENPPIVSDEEVVVQDQAKVGIEAEVF